MSQSDKNSIKLQQEVEIECENDQDEDNDQEQDNEQAQQQQAISANALDGTSQQLIKKRSHRKLDISNFIMKTYKILEDKKNSNIVEWCDQGNCFIVKEKDRFSKEILPKYFKHCKFSSFVRQLNMYDFHKIRKQKEIPIFKHKYFQENRMDLLHKIKRKSGEDGKQQELISKQQINFSQPNIQSKVQVSYNNIKPNTQALPSTKSQIQILRKQNLELQQSINDLSQQIQFLQMSKEKKKEKLVKIITSIMFFDLNNNKETKLEDEDNVQSYENNTTLRSLQQHFVRDEEPLSFSQYRNRLSQIYGSLKARLLI